MNVALLLAVFTTPVAVGVVMGWLSWLLPRRRLTKAFTVSS